MKKCILLCTAFVLVLNMLCSCGKPQELVPSGSVSVTVMVDSDENLPMWSYIRAASGMEIKLDVMPADRIREALLLHQSADQLPNLVYLKSSSDMEALVECDLLVDLREYEDSLPEYQRAAFVSETSDESIHRHSAADGGHYVLPALGVSRTGVERAWLYRADVFEQVNLEVPNTMQELAKVAISLKKAFPNSTPIALRDGFYGLDLLAPAWKKDASIGVYYDFEREKWAYGATENWMGNFVSFWASLYRSGLLPQNYLTMSSAEVDSEIAQNRVFVIPDSVWRLEEYKRKYPNQDWRIMPPPKAATEGAQHKIAKRESNFEGYAICKKSEGDIVNSVAFLNWMYSQDAEQVLSWGVEGESYTENQLEKKLILSKDEDARTRYGIGTDGLRTQLSPQVAPYLFLNERINNADIAAIYTETYINPARYLQFTDEEQEKIWFTQKKLDVVYNAGVTEFLTGRWPMEHWEAFAESLEDLDVNQLLDAYEKAYNRVIE